MRNNTLKLNLTQKLIGYESMIKFISYDNSKLTMEVKK